MSILPNGETITAPLLMIFSLSSFPVEVRATISNDKIMLYGADGKEWARIIRTGSELIPFPTDDIPNDCKEILDNVCKAAMKGI